MSVFWDGVMLKITGQFKDDDGVLSDPTTVKFVYQIDDGVVTVDSSPVHDSLGNYHVELDTAGKSGRYTWRWQTSGVPQVVTPDEVFVVRPTKVPG